GRGAMRGAFPGPASLVDISGVVAKQIEYRDGAIAIAAGATHAEVASAAVLHTHLPVLAAVVGHIGDPAVRHRGTLGGALAANEPAGDYPPARRPLRAPAPPATREVRPPELFL